MSELSRNDGVQWSREVEGLSIVANQVKRAVSLALDLFLTREDSDDWLVIDRSLFIATGGWPRRRLMKMNLGAPHADLACGDFQVTGPAAYNGGSVFVPR